ncbi:SMP-30/gluconolactonase/LRE family protein [Ramlibacter sp. G-1-2-2]|uniref:SMP-30/gluconolactonase/LRE family protein n=1 Tax=Ramlibacter agri TaxID=2728837 RepID=A0A848H9I6_9BURK|nr:SMP-30/gluconolactonase/LRE family protein [Ramlibacter agri]NML47425.1 SMP-30/gluconolactonase/LRE family protein [Ramlibacter agri]
MKVLAEGLRFPEGPVALSDGSVCFVEIAAGRVSRVTKDGAVQVVAETGGGPNGLAVGPDGALYVCNNGGFIVQDVDGECHVVHGELPPDYETGSIQRIDMATGAVRTLYTHCGDVPLTAPNDLVFDAHGGFYFTDFGKIRHRQREVGSIYYALPDGSGIVEVAHPVANPNGVGLAPDQKTLYVSETETSRLWAFPIVEPGQVAKASFPSPNGGRLVCGLPGYQRFDSLAVQANGSICVATLVTGAITVISPSGQVERVVKMPEPYSTNICFGGPDRKKAYVTLSWTGRLIELDWEEAGLALNFNL